MFLVHSLCLEVVGFVFSYYSHYFSRMIFLVYQVELREPSFLFFMWSQSQCFSRSNLQTFYQIPKLAYFFLNHTHTNQFTFLSYEKFGQEIKWWNSMKWTGTVILYARHWQQKVAFRNIMGTKGVTGQKNLWLIFSPRLGSFGWSGEAG